VNEMMNPSGMLIVFSAPSGSGKTTLLFEILKNHPEFHFSVSVTTRAPRSDEQNGVNYHFLSEEEFEALIRNDELLEWNEVYENKYGTLKRTVKEVLQKGKSIILDTDTVGAFNIRKYFPDAVLVFIIPPSPVVLYERLKNRHTESHEAMEKRLKAVPKEIARMTEYDYIVINDDFMRALSQVNAIIEAEKLRTSRVFPALCEWRNFCDG
jgi:guanylate kinase